MMYPRCERCKTSTKWTFLKSERVLNSTIDFYKCSSCNYDMSWSYTRPENTLKEA